MIELYTGTPGSGKSLHAAADIKYWVENKREPVICNFNINNSLLRQKGRGQIITIKNSDIKDKPEIFKDISDIYKKKLGINYIKEDTILIILDESQLLYNSRSWNDKSRSKWISFFSQHRKLGFKIIMIAQYAEMIDKQIRALVEFEYSHRKVKNISKSAAMLNIVSGGGLHVAVKYYAPFSEKVDQKFFKGNRILYSLYDSYTLFE